MQCVNPKWFLSWHCLYSTNITHTSRLYVDYETCLICMGLDCMSQSCTYYTSILLASVSHTL